MGISRAKRFKHRATGGRYPVHQKKKKHEMGRPPSNTRLGPQRVRPVRVRGGGVKYRALRLDAGSFSWASENITRKTRISGVVYNPTSNELVRTNTLTKSTIVYIDSTPFKQWYHKNYGVELQKKKRVVGDDGEAHKEQQDDKVDPDIKDAKKRRFALDRAVADQVGGGRVLAIISSRPGQCGRATGYILEGKELEFYKKKMEKKKK